MLEGPVSSVPVSPAAPAAAATSPRDPAAISPAPVSAIAEGDACLKQLADLGIAHQKLETRRGVKTPVVVTGPLGGIEYVAGAGLAFEADCRLAVALHQIGPALGALGIDRLRYSGAYTYRMSRTGRLSLHAYGLAIDVHAAHAAGRWYEVKRDYRRGLADQCAEDAPIPNRMRCVLAASGMFKELITPDHNADHHDHLHLAIAPLPDQKPDAPSQGVSADRGAPASSSAFRAAAP